MSGSFTSKALSVGRSWGPNTTTGPPDFFFDLCVVLGLRPINESLSPPSLPSNGPCRVGTPEVIIDTPRIETEMTCTYPPPPIPTWEMAVKISFYLLTMAAAFLGNALICFVVLRTRRLHNRTFVFIFNLAISDFLVSVFSMWPHLGTGMTAEYPFPDIVCKFTSFFQGIRISALYIIYYCIYYTQMYVVDLYHTQIIQRKS